MRAQLHHKDDFLTGVSDVYMGPLLSLEGKPLGGKFYGDAEAVYVLRGDSQTDSQAAALVSFEVWHRLWLYPLDARGNPSGIPTAILGNIDLPGDNRGLESVVVFRNGHILAFTEDVRDERGFLRGVLIQDKKTFSVWLDSKKPFTVSDMTVLPDGSLLILERYFSYTAGFRTRLRRISKEQLKILAKDVLAKDSVLRGTHVGSFSSFTHNPEGLAVRQKDTEILVYVLTDDNFFPFVGTVLYQFVLLE